MIQPLQKLNDKTIILNQLELIADLGLFRGL